MATDNLYIPPKPLSLWSVVALARVLWKGDGNLLELLPAAAYRFDVGNLGYSRRSTVLFNNPDTVREIMRDAGGVFSTPLQSGVAVDVFEDFTLFEKSAVQVDVLRLILKPAWSEFPQPPEVLNACERIRHHLGVLVDSHLDDPSGFDDIASSVIAARDRDTGEPFTRKELIDQLGVFFLAGHETTASVLTWAFYVLADQPQWRERLRDEIGQVVGDGRMTFEHTRQLPLTKAFFKETLRLYPPITFMPRVATRETTIGGRRLRKGALVMVAPWTLHRHAKWWDEPHAFRPERFLPEHEKELVQGAYIPFGQGPHTCVGAGFAQTESVLILAELVRHFDWSLAPGQSVRPAARMTTRPASQVMIHVGHRPV
jgi:cytochrome P450